MIRIFTYMILSQGYFFPNLLNADTDLSKVDITEHSVPGNSVDILSIQTYPGQISSVPEGEQPVQNEPFQDGYMYILPIASDTEISGTETPFSPLNPLDPNVLEPILLEQILSQNISPEQIILEQFTPEKVLPEQVISEQPQSSFFALEDTTFPQVFPFVPSQVLPEQVIPEQVIPDQVVPEQVMIEQIPLDSDAMVFNPNFSGPNQNSENLFLDSFKENSDENKSTIIDDQQTIGDGNFQPFDQTFVPTHTFDKDAPQYLHQDAEAIHTIIPSTHVQLLWKDDKNQWISIPHNHISATPMIA